MRQIPKKNPPQCHLYSLVLEFILHHFLLIFLQYLRIRFFFHYFDLYSHLVMVDHVLIMLLCLKRCLNLIIWANIGPNLNLLESSSNQCTNDWHLPGATKSNRPLIMTNSRCLLWFNSPRWQLPSMNDNIISHLWYRFNTWSSC